MSYLSRRELKYASDEKDARIAQLTSREVELVAIADGAHEGLCNANAKIDELVAQVEKYREALEKITNLRAVGLPQQTASQARHIARNALGEG